MDLRDTPEEAAFRSGLRTWLEEHLPDDLQGHRGGATRFDGPEMRDGAAHYATRGTSGSRGPRSTAVAARPTRTRRSSSRRWPAPKRRRTSA